MASWHRFFLDFDRFLGASWEAKWSQDRSKKASKNDAKNSSLRSKNVVEGRKEQQTKEKHNARLQNMSR